MALVEFQFHKGTIRTQWQPYNASLCNDFNSIKVQLELETLISNATIDIYFNSIKVQLEPVNP